ncbi:MAG TPA: alpha/beta hydrolase fold domain-containing protein [Caulobacteraceae bacterium]|nr:alpha/beta hydrolase fold domain-containing protein [Caulobacteraceae bacterium]
MDDLSAVGAPIAAELLPFVRSIQQAQTAALPITKARMAAEATRAPWRAGGPVMAQVLERSAPGPAGPIRVRFYDPGEGEGGARAVLIYLHGGGWTMFSLETHDRLMREYAAGSGLIVVGVDYALSPEAKFPEALEEVGAVVDWLAGQDPSFGIDAGRLFIGGDSAGANLALAAAISGRDRHHAPALAGLLLNYGVFLARSSPEAVAAYGGPEYMLTAEEMASFWRNYLGDPSQAEDPLASPLLADLRGLPPTFLAIAECDILAEQSVALAKRLRAAGVDTTAETYRGATHSFLEAVSIAPLSRRAFADENRWLRARAAAPVSKK